MTTQKIKDTAEDVKKTVGEVAEDTADKLQDEANDVLERAKGAARRLQGDDPTDRWAERVKDLASCGVDAAREKVDEARSLYRRYADATTSYVHEQPVKAALVAAAVGAALAALIIGARGRNRD